MTSTAVLAAVVAGLAFTVPLLARQGLGSTEAAAVPVGATTTSGNTPMAGQAPKPSTKPQVAQPTKTPVGPPGSLPSQQPGLVTVTGPPSTVAVGPPGPNLPGVTTTTKTTTIGRPPVRNTPPSVTTTQNPPRGTSGTKPPAVAAAPAGSVSVQNYGSNRCIDVKDAQNGVGNDGTPLQLWDCAQSSNQRWSFNADGTVRSLGLCMDLAWASTAENTQVQLVNCNGGWAQKFTLNSAHDLVNPTANKCVTAVSSGNGAQLVLRSCAGTSNQKWHKA
jgi:hypothetical protein